MTPAQYCEDKTRGAGSSFFYAFMFLPAEQRRAMMALYAFCREVDDIADGVHDADTAMRKLHYWRQEVACSFQGNAQHPVARELQWAARRFGFQAEMFEEIMDGMAMDIAGQPINKAADLALYCYRVAGIVGLLSIEVFGYHNRRTRNFATTLGEALQLTNILRDLKEDAARGRIYIPLEERARFGVSDEDFKQGRMHDALASLLAHYGNATEQRYQEALRLLPDEDRTALRPSLVMGAIYYAHFQRLQAVHFDVWRQQVRLSPLQKMWIAWRAWRREGGAGCRRLPPRFDF